MRATSAAPTLSSMSTPTPTSVDRSSKDSQLESGEKKIGDFFGFLAENLVGGWNKWTEIDVEFFVSSGETKTTVVVVNVVVVVVVVVERDFFFCPQRRLSPVRESQESVTDISTFFFHRANKPSIRFLGLIWRWWWRWREAKSFDCFCETRQSLNFFLFRELIFSSWSSDQFIGCL